MRRFLGVSFAASAGLSALGFVALPSAHAADMYVPEGQQYQAPPPAAYGPPPAQESYAYPPPVPYGYPPPVAYYAYAPRPYVVVPGPYYGRGRYWGYGPRFAYGYGYGHWGRGHRR